MKKSRGFLSVLLLALLALFLGAGAAFLGFKWAAQSDDGGTFTKEGILKILAVESTVYFNDGKTKVGTFFEGQHRDYVPFDSIPRSIIDALVSAEDAHYWDHGGIDPKAIAYAMLDNIKAGSMRRGGSTLTQQTAKNLFNRKGRTLSGKLKELVNALRLEKHFTKQEILEFYLNQFFVAGNGHGVRIAARYFFNKELNDLDLTESAFIAGSVKGPNQYNPFLADSEDKKQAILKKGRSRVGYVLSQMRRHEKITEAQYRNALAHPLAFRRGDFRYSLSTNLAKVKRIMDKPEIQAALDAHDVADWMAEGLQIVTTLDPNLQRATENATYLNLARLDIILRGYHPPSDTERVSTLSHFEPANFAVGRVVGIESQSGSVHAIDVEFGALKGRVTGLALERFFRYLNQHETGSADLPAPKKQGEWASNYFHKGRHILCLTPFVVGSDTTQLADQLEIIQRPLVQGGAEILKGGRVLANVGGFANTGYDRVNQARRQFGSTFKPFVYAAALELGWKPLDALPNFRQAFRLGNTFYFPKPDHAPEDTVSLVWAGRRSENIASVYLLYHLFDKADFARFWQAAREVGVAPEAFPMQEEFAVFVRDSLGVVLDDTKMRELRYQKEAQDLAIDITFEGRVNEGEQLKTLPYGQGFHAERQKVLGSRDPEDAIRQHILKRCYIEYLAEAVIWDKRMSEGLHLVMARRTSNGSIGLFEVLPDSGWELMSDPNLNTPDDSVLIDGQVSVGAIKKIRERLDAKEPTDESGSVYTKENLYALPDFRALVALRHVVNFSRKLGVKSPLDPVLSYPLGVNVITLGEAMSAYQAFQDGYAYSTRGGESQLFVERIALRDGTVIWQDVIDREKVITEKTRFGLEAILGSVVEGGTGQQISRDLRIAAGEKGEVNLRLPAYGKTGTTNDYRNAAFIGFLSAPMGAGKGFDAASGFTVGVYAGFDDNQSMLRRGFKGTGASVAIPAWIAMSKSVAESEHFRENADVLDLEVQATGEPSLFQEEKYQKYLVSRRTGLPLNGGSELTSVLYTEDLSDELTGPEGAAAGALTATVKIREE